MCQYLRAEIEQNQVISGTVANQRVALLTAKKFQKKVKKVLYTNYNYKIYIIII